MYRQHVALGIRAGQSTLFAFEYDGCRYLMIGVLRASKLQQGKVGKENRHWKHVAPHHTELAILPKEMAETFCWHAVESFRDYRYIQDWVGIFSPTEGGRIPVRMRHIELLGDTRSADDLGVFCTMPSERLSIGCGLETCARTEESRPNQRSALLEAATKLLRFLLLLDQQNCDDREQEALRRVCQQLRQQPDGHFVSMVSSLLLGILACGWDLVRLRVGVGRVADCSKRRDMRCFGAADAAETGYITNIHSVLLGADCRKGDLWKVSSFCGLVPRCNHRL